MFDSFAVALCAVDGLAVNTRAERKSNVIPSWFAIATALDAPVRPAAAGSGSEHTFSRCLVPFFNALEPIVPVRSGICLLESPASDDVMNASSLHEPPFANSVFYFSYPPINDFKALLAFNGVQPVHTESLAENAATNAACPSTRSFLSELAQKTDKSTPVRDRLRRDAVLTASEQISASLNRNINNYPKFQGIFLFHHIQGTQHRNLGHRFDRRVD